MAQQQQSSDSSQELTVIYQDGQTKHVFPLKSPKAGSKKKDQARRSKTPERNILSQQEPNIPRQSVGYVIASQVAQNGDNTFGNSNNNNTQVPSLPYNQSLENLQEPIEEQKLSESSEDTFKMSNDHQQEASPNNQTFGDVSQKEEAKSESANNQSEQKGLQEDNEEEEIDPEVEKQMNAILDELEKFIAARITDCQIVVDQTVQGVVDQLPQDVLNMDIEDFAMNCADDPAFDNRFNLEFEIKDNFNLLGLAQIMQEVEQKEAVEMHEVACGNSQQHFQDEGVDPMTQPPVVLAPQMISSSMQCEEMKSQPIDLISEQEPQKEEQKSHSSVDQVSVNSPIEENKASQDVVMQLEHLQIDSKKSRQHRNSECDQLAILHDSEVEDHNNQSKHKQSQAQQQSPQDLEEEKEDASKQPKRGRGKSPAQGKRGKTKTKSAPKQKKQPSAPKVKKETKPKKEKKDAETQVRDQLVPSAGMMTRRKRNKAKLLQ